MATNGCLPRHTKQRPRRGMVLLVVIALLVLFTVIAVTFVLVATQYRKSSKNLGRHDQYRDDYRRVLDDALGQLLHDTTNPNSALQTLSLLEDLYGSSGVTCVLDSADFVPSSTTQVIQFQAAAVAPGALARQPGYYNGCVLTILNGPLRGQSTRIIGYDSNRQLRVLPFERVVTAADVGLPDTNAKSPLNGRLARINGRPFGGTGTGYNPATGMLDAADGAGREFALLLNPRNPAYRAYINGPDGIPNTADDMPLSANEDYDAPDPQNPFLAYVPAEVTTSGQILPSFHRPDLVNYWKNRDASFDTNADLQRQVMLRPNKLDHPEFTGSNPSFDPVIGPWDVDGDGDGIADSVWLDLGYPVETAPDGRLYKPLFAILCTDLDGRLNVNAHGSLAQLEPSFSQPFPWPLAGGLSQVPISPRGEGYGPAEISLRGLFNNDAEYGKLLCGDANYEGRYGAQDGAGLALPGTNGVDDYLSQVKFFEYPLPGNSAVLSSFGTPENLCGRGSVFLDPVGAPVRPYMGGTFDTRNSPYALNLSRPLPRAAMTKGGIDNPFTVAEIERVLRKYDVDARSLPDRLRYFLDPTGTSSLNHRLLIGEGFDLPVPSMVPPREMRDGSVGSLKFAGHIADVARERLKLEGGITDEATINLHLGRMFPPDLMAGLRLDINRPFGNGRDDNNNGIVDESEEAASGEPYWTPNGTVPFQHAGGVAISPLLTRSLQARYLYVLVMLVKHPAAQIDFDGNPDNDTPEETARGLAQWAINVVDFRDRDSIMTPFEYDVHPFDGWSVDGDPSTTSDPDRGLVWGCERPELLLTESVAWHDRRTEDLDTEVPTSMTDQPAKTSDPDPTTKDQDFDQRLRPIGSLFVELYNPWTAFNNNVPLGAGFDTMAEMPPGELWVDGLDGNRHPNNGVQLNKIAPGGAPVWRLLVVKGESSMDKDPDDPDVAKRPAASDLERRIYFAQPPAPAQGDYWRGASIPIAPLLPGRYAVVGSSGYSYGSGLNAPYVSPVGRRDGAADGKEPPAFDNTRRVKLTPSANPAVNQLEVRDNTVADEADFPHDNNHRQPIIAVPIDQPRSVSVSEPVGGYPSGPSNPPGVTWYSDLSGGEGAYADAADKEKPKSIDVPLDADSRYSVDTTALLRTGTTPKFRVIHLQRLANPLEPYNETTNPYLTIDSLSVDLTAFNGVTKDEDPNAVETTIHFQSLQRGDHDDSSPPARDLWSSEPAHNDADLSPTPEEDEKKHVFTRVLEHSLGVLNAKFRPYYDTSSAPPDPEARAPNAYIGAPKTWDSSDPLPFPWLSWNNRPYISPMELLYVPKSRSSQLLKEFSLAGASDAPLGYAPEESRPAPFGHLLNFFQKSSLDGAGLAPHLCRIFDYLQAPSRFVGTETLLNPAVFSNPNPSQTVQAEFWQCTYPPFNRASNFRDPGRLNINTVNSPIVWEAAAGGPNPLLRHYAPDFTAIVESRRGYRDGIGFLTLDRNVPTCFANPFRSPSAGSLTLPCTSARADVDVSLLRSRDPAPSSTSRDSKLPLFDALSARPANETGRNPYFRFRDVQRMANLLTTRSSVFAVWITVGRFQVTAAPPGYDKNVYPDGCRLGSEIGIDTGDIERHRAFYLIDRSIPVGYERGQSHNTQRAVLVRRQIE